jgi:hypothetical protein
MRLTNVFSGRPNYYDRNPLSVGGSFQNDAQVPHGVTNQFTYTVPTGRKAFVTSLAVSIVRMTAAAPVGICNVTARWDLNDEAIVLVTFDNTVGGGRALAAGGGSIVLAGKTFTFASQDLSTGGTMSFESGASIIEFDA